MLIPLCSVQPRPKWQWPSKLFARFGSTNFRPRIRWNHLLKILLCHVMHAQFNNDSRNSRKSPIWSNSTFANINTLLWCGLDGHFCNNSWQNERRKSFMKSSCFRAPFFCWMKWFLHCRDLGWLATKTWWVQVLWHNFEGGRHINKRSNVGPRPKVVVQMFPNNCGPRQRRAGALMCFAWFIEQVPWKTRLENRSLISIG